ncbi:MAG: hypothetical protein ABSF21_04375 [Dehalococcoidia bacterium]
MENEEKLGRLSNRFRKALENVIARCKKANVEYAWDSGFLEEFALIIYVQKGMSKEKIFLLSAEDAKELLDSDFEKYVFVEGYRDAICCYEKGCVEARVKCIGRVADAGKAAVLSRIMGMKHKEVKNKIKDGVDVRLELNEGGDKGVRISIGNPSETFVAMTVVIDREEAMSVRVEGLQITNNKEAAEQLERVTNSLFFELGRKRRVNLFVSRQYEVEKSAGKAKWRVKKERESKVSFPKFEYDKEPIELYWHAVSAYKMPLLQYLAYYQILEYYFPKYSMLGAKREISNCLKDPNFNVDDDNDITKIVTCVSGKLGRYVSENELLGDTLRGFVSEDELVSEVNSEPLKEYFTKKYKIVSQFRVSKDNKDKDIREQLADRIYDIRCRIVHTKEEDKRGRLLPFTKEEGFLREFDLPMVENLANKVLIANSKKLSFR